jgi:hypothetical protein
LSARGVDRAAFSSSGNTMRALAKTQPFQHWTWLSGWLAGAVMTSNR